MPIGQGDVVPPLEGPVRIGRVAVQDISEVGHVSRPLVDEGGGHLLLKGDDDAVGVDGLGPGLELDLAVCIHIDVGEIKISRVKSRTVVGSHTHVTARNGVVHKAGIVCEGHHDGVGGRHIGEGVFPIGQGSGTAVHLQQLHDVPHIRRDRKGLVVSVDHLLVPVRINVSICSLRGRDDELLGDEGDIDGVI